MLSAVIRALCCFVRSVGPFEFWQSRASVRKYHNRLICFAWFGNDSSSERSKVCCFRGRDRDEAIRPGFSDNNARCRLRRRLRLRGGRTEWNPGREEAEEGTADEDPRGAMERGANAVSFEHGSHIEERALVQSCSTTLDPYTVLPLRSYRSAGSSRRGTVNSSRRFRRERSSALDAPNRRLRAVLDATRRVADIRRVYISCFLLLTLTRDLPDDFIYPSEASSPEHVSNVNHALGSGWGLNHSVTGNSRSQWCSRAPSDNSC